MRTMNIRTIAFVLLALSIICTVYAGRDVSTIIGTSLLLGPASYSADVSGSDVDVGNFDGTAIVITSGIGTWNATDSISFILKHADTATTTAYTEVEAEDMIGVVPNASGVVHTISANQASAQLKKVGYVGGKQYLKLTADFNGSASGTPLSAIAVKGHPHVAPVD